ncbi:PREDICTED: uncharacterized protein LOC104597575 [Nelumbo nucifera]|nr:PREDICTED: uncharacterized protein LOC104597575 [Nelumbo nucifera]
MVFNFNFEGAGLGDMLLKVAIFLLVQALVYFILSNSSNIFSNNVRRSSLRTVRSVSIRRILAALSDLPGEPSPLGSMASSPSPKSQQTHEADH